VHAVGNIEKRQAFAAQALEHGKNLGHVGRGERRRGLIKNQDARLAGQRLGDFHHLAARQGKVLHEGKGMNVFGSGPGQSLFGDLALPGAVNHAEARGRIADHDIVGDRKIGNEREFLKNADDACLIGGGWRGK